jgi:hypothetical protein
MSEVSTGIIGFNLQGVLDIIMARRWEKVYVNIFY